MYEGMCHIFLKKFPSFYIKTYEFRRFIYEFRHIVNFGVFLVYDTDIKTKEGNTDEEE